MQAEVATWVIAAVATAGVIIRPFGVPEFVWAMAGAVGLVMAGLLSWPDALAGAAKGTDVYLFLTGMMLLAEIARQEGLFDWLAAHAASHAKGSPTRLFTLIYLVGTLVTVFLSNDATAVVLTPAVAAVARAARAEEPMPYLLVCAFIANAASFVLPISNPANLVIYGGRMPPLLDWVAMFALPSILAIVATYAVLRVTQRRDLRQAIAKTVEIPVLSAGGQVAGWGIVVTAVVLMVASGLNWQLGLPTFLAGGATAGAVMMREKRAPWPVLREVSGGVLPLVAGLFVLVEALDRTGVTGRIGDLLRQAEGWPRIGAGWMPGIGAGWPVGSGAGWAAGVVVAVTSNLANNLPVGLISASALQAASASPRVSGAVLIGVDLGPNLSVTGSLATILWLSALRRDGLHAGAWAFLKVGCLAMPPALLLALAGLLVGRGM